MEDQQEFYTEERWQNWLERIEDEEIDPEDEESARLLLNLQDDAALAVVKVVSEHEDGNLSTEQALDEIATIRDIVLGDPEIENEETALLIDGVQTSLMCVFYAAEEYVSSGAAEEGDVDAYLHAAADAEAQEDLDAALGYAAQAGTLLFGGAALDTSIAEELEYGLVTEWINGLDSLENALSDPEVIEEE